jgi:hypothetical protein
MVLYGMKITITMSDDIYGKLEKDRGMVPRATYIQGLIMGGVKGASRDILEGLRELEGRGSSSVAKVREEDYSELVEKVGNSFERELGFEERQELNREIKAAGLVWNSYAKRLEKSEGGKFKLIHQF